METKRLASGEAGKAAALLRAGGLVALPTETVYGLGADGLNPDAVKAIFAAKGRPQDNPLILHIPTADWLERYCGAIPAAAHTLADRFWPGPLTMILPCKKAGDGTNIVPAAVTAGLDTVGMRCPDCAVTRAVIAAAGVPVAAPSGNTSGRPSPTSAAAMLEDMEGKIDAILDGSILKAETKTIPYFDLAVPTALPGVDPAILDPRDTYGDPAEWDAKAKDLAGRFVKNFVKYTGNDAGKALVAAGPKV